jgi:hypothetical protein
LVLLAYILLGLALTWPLAPHFGSHVPGNGVDDPPLTWNLWWVKHALLELHSNPFESDYIFYPIGINLAFYTLTVLNGLLSIPLQAVLGLIPASNLLLLASFVLSGYGAFLLAKYLLESSFRDESEGFPANGRLSAWAAFVAGILYAFASSKMAYAALGQWNIASSQWIPFYVLYLLKMGDHPRSWRYPLLAALFLIDQAYAEVTYTTFLALFTGAWLLWQGFISWRDGKLHTLIPLVTRLMLLGAVFLAGLAPLLAMMLPDMQVEGDIFVESGGFADVFSADLLGYLVPTMHHPLLGSLVRYFEFDHDVGQHIYPGYLVMVLAGAGLAYGLRRKNRPEQLPVAARWTALWLLSTLGFWILTLGPSLRINGQDTGLPLPFALVARLPFFEGNRYPSRYSVMLMLSLAMLVAIGIKALGAKLATRHRSGLALYAPLLLVAGLVLFEHLSVPLPLSDMRAPAIYETIAHETAADATLLDLPVAWRNGFRVTGTQHPIIMFSQYYQSVHGKRLLSGNTSRNPPLKFQYFTEAPVINTLIALETGHEVDPTVLERDRSLAPEVLRFFNIAAIVVHPEQTGPQMVPYLEATMPVERLGEQSGIVAYRTKLPPWPQTWTVAPDSDLGQLSYAEGWGVGNGGIIWAQRQSTRLLLPVNGQQQELALDVYAPQPDQKLRIEVQEQILGEFPLKPGWQTHQVTIPAGAISEGLAEVWLHFETLYPTRQIRLSPRNIGQTGVESPANLVVQSAGQEVGDFGQVYVDGQPVSTNERGYNLVVIHPDTGQVEQSVAFDTHLDPGASRALAAFLASVPEGRIVAVAAADEASRLLDSSAVEALHGIGASGDLRGKTRWGHAILGVKGASPGTALEAMGWMRPVTVVAGEGATEPDLAAAFGTIELTTPGAP